MTDDWTGQGGAEGTAAGADPLTGAGTDTQGPLAAMLPGGGQGHPQPLGLEVEETGNGEVDAVLARLEALDGAPTDAHVAVYEDVHQRLRDTLSALDNRPGPLPPSVGVPGPPQVPRS